MIYGEPRHGRVRDYRAINEYEFWRRKTRNDTMNERLSELERALSEGSLSVSGQEYLEGFFDAISPRINDLLSWEELEEWLLESGFEDIQRTVDTRNHHVIAIKRLS